MRLLAWKEVQRILKKKTMYVIPIFKSFIRPNNPLSTTYDCKIFKNKIKLFLLFAHLLTLDSTQSIGLIIKKYKGLRISRLKCIRNSRLIIIEKITIKL